MGSLLSSTVCHYCGKKATTEDHIVPKALLPKPMSRVPYWFRSNDVVPACFDCNGEKGMERSDCDCAQCVWAWAVATKLWIDPNIRPRRTVVLVGGKEQELLG
jgi:5-methylcytosine-specific restriction endonuclease McrA